MFKYSDKILKKDIDTYIFLSCGNIKKNLKMFEKNMKITLPVGIDKYLSTKKIKIYKTLINNKLYIIVKLDQNGCNLEKINLTMKMLARVIYNDDAISSIQMFLSPIKELIRYQVTRFIYYVYRFTKYKEKKEDKESRVWYDTGNVFFTAAETLKNQVESAIKEGEIINDARTMINEPANIMTTTGFVDIVKKLQLKKSKVEILNKTKLKKQGLNLITGVNQGSMYKPYLLILKWMPLKKKKPVVITGKGVMFDSGGINIKRYEFADMKTDMTGAAVALAVFRLIVEQNIKKNVVAIMPLVENMVSKNAIRPGDVLKSYSGKHVEIVNTDAEGRLILADSIAYSKKFKPKAIIDIATLTGGAGYIFNNLAIVTMGNNQKLKRKFNKSCQVTGEKVWDLPLWNDYRELLNSEVADIKNVSYVERAGTIVAGMFLNEFVPPNTDWLHLDIAGVSFEEDSVHHGATGASILSIFECIKNL